MGRPVKNIIRHLNLELIAWSGLLMAPFLINPYDGNYPSFCLFHNLGLNFCPGCGLGRSLALLYRGDFVASFLTHPLAIFFVAIIGSRIVTLISKSVENHNQRIGVSHG